MPLGLGFIGHTVARLVFVASLVAAVWRRDTSLFSVGLFAFVVLELIVFYAGRLEPDARDPVTRMQLRRYGRGDAPH